MPRQRFIWPQFWDDPDLGILDSDARLLYIGCFSLADDEGRIIGDPVHLRAAIFKYRPDITVDRVQQLRDALESACRCFRVYTVRKIEYIAFTNWADFQKPKYPSPSRIPAPPKTRRSRRKPAPLSQTDSGNDSGNRSGNDSGSASRNASGNDSSTGWVGLGSTKPPTPPVDLDEHAEREPTPADVLDLTNTVAGAQDLNLELGRRKSRVGQGT